MSGENAGVNIGENAGSDNKGTNIPLVFISIVGYAGDEYITVNFNMGVALDSDVMGATYNDGITIYIEGVQVVRDYITALPSSGILKYSISGGPLVEGDTILVNYASGNIIAAETRVPLLDPAAFSYALAATILYVRNIDFELGVPGQPATGAASPHGYDGYASAPTNIFDNAHTTPSSNVSVKSTVLGGTCGDNDGFTFGGRFEHSVPPGMGNLVQGDEVWYRVSIYYPSDWLFNTCNEGLKTIRMHTPSGNIDLYTNRGGQAHKCWSELAGPDFTANNGSGFPPGQLNEWGFESRVVGDPVTLGGWNTYEVNIKFHSASNAGHWQIWQDGKLVWKDTKTYTLKSSNDFCDYTTMYTYWNCCKGETPAPQTQSCWIDDVIIQTAVPTNWDEAGNPMIGPIGWVNP